MPSYFLWIMLIGMLLMMWFVSRRQRAMQEEQKRRTEKGLVPGNWVRTIGGFYGTVVEVDGDVVTLATPLGDETLWSKRAIAAVEEPPFGSASANDESGTDVEQADDDIRESEQDTAEPQS